MTNEDIEQIYRISRKRVREVSLSLKRYLYEAIDWSDRLVCIKGARGVGKTTLMLQHMRERADDMDALYASLDNVWVDAKNIYKLAEHHESHGGTHLFLDEVHKLENWQDLIKSLNDDFPKMHIVYSGSSLLRLEGKGGDLSRRRVAYNLAGLSFREYLRFEGVGDFPPLNLADVLEKHVKMADGICGQVKVFKYFDRYRLNGFYPFYKEGVGHYQDRLLEVVNKVLESDYPAVEEVEVSTIRKARRMLDVLSASAPLTPNMERLYAELGTDRKQGLKMLYALERAGLLSLLASKKASLKNLSTPDKIYCQNSNLMRALRPSADIGTERETMVFNQLRAAGHDVTYPVRGDFCVDGKLLLEVGGPGKGFNQIKDIPNSYVVLDDVEVGVGNKIPLWLFGFLY